MPNQSKTAFPVSDYFRIYTIFQTKTLKTIPSGLHILIGPIIINSILRVGQKVYVILQDTLSAAACPGPTQKQLPIIIRSFCPTPCFSTIPGLSLESRHCFPKDRASSSIFLHFFAFKDQFIIFFSVYCTSI